jgi:hypothetical protein
MAKALSVIPAIFPAGESMSEVAVLGVTGNTVVGIAMPTASWIPAVVTLQGSPDGVNFYDVYDGVTGQELSFNVVPHTMGMINPNRLRCCQAVILRSGTRAAPVPQTSGVRIFGIVVEASA